MACILALLVLLVVPCSLGRTTRKNDRNNEDLRSVSERLQVRVTPKALQLLEGSSAVLECTAAGHPLPTLHWRKDGRRLTTTDPQVVDQVGRGVFGVTFGHLHLECVGEEEQGVYECVAEEGANSNRSAATVTVTPASSTVTCHKSEGVPHVVSWSRTVVQTQGEDVRLQCQATGSPTPTITWLDKDNKTIAATNTKFMVSSGGDELLIRDLSWSDMGNYVCVAHNQHGSDSKECFVYPASPED